MDRRTFLRGSAIVGGAAGLMGPLQALGVRTAGGAPRALTVGYGDLVDKGDLMLPPGLQLRHHLAAGRHHVGRQPHARDLRRHGRLPGLGLHRPHPQPRESPAGQRDPGRRPRGAPVRRRPDLRRRQHEAPHQGQRPPRRLHRAGELRRPRRDGHELRGRRDPLADVDHLRRGRQPGQHRQEARVCVRGRFPGDRAPRGDPDPRAPVASPTRRPRGTGTSSTRRRTAGTAASTAICPGGRSSATGSSPRPTESCRRSRWSASPARTWTRGGSPGSPSPWSG